MSLIAYKIPDTLDAEITELESLIAAFRNNALSEVELKARRVPFGIYEQRKKGTYMVRVRCTAGIITPVQLKRVAELSLRFASGSLHLTTRQEIQIHDVALEDLIPIIRALADVGLSTRGGGGNTVRNITAPWDSGIAIDEVFDVTPYAIALTSELIARGDSWLLPRKYKIAFSNTVKDTGFATVNDLGLIAQIKNGEKGFRVFVAGGMGRQSEPGHLLHDFVPGSQIFLIAEAIKRVFSKHGNRKNKHAARLRFLWNTLGRDQFIELYEVEKKQLIGEGIGSLKILNISNEINAPEAIPTTNDSSEEFALWKQRYVGTQKQSGAYSVRLPLLLGMIRAENARDIADALIPFGDNAIRFTHDQNIVFRNISSNHLEYIYKVSKKASDLISRVPLFGNAVACAGASTCQLGICRSRGALEAIIDRLKGSSVNLDGVSELRIHVSGCSNTCGQHVIADIGVFGKVGRKDQHSYPAYTIVAGAKLGINGKTQLAEKIDEINAHDLPVLIERLLEHYNERKYLYSDFYSYLAAEGKNFISNECDIFRDIPSYDIDRSYYRDWGDTEIFSLAGKGTGECSAGLFDLIEIDLTRLRQIRTAILEKGIGNSTAKELHELLLISSRMLLITRGVEGSSESDVFEKFTKLFIGEKLVDSGFIPVVDAGRLGNIETIAVLRSDVVDLSNAVELLYQGMDNSLQFKVPASAPAITPLKVSPDAGIKVDLVSDFRGIACPMNFVKTKIALSRLSKDQVLEITLDDGAPIDNVPKSVAEEGHAIISTDRIDNYWMVRIRKQ